jgi:surfeit locus 1 family protein
MTRWPPVPTLIVALAVAAMLALGVWQLQRRGEKLAYIERVSANAARPAMAFPRFADESVLLRRAAGYCLRPVSHRLEGAGAGGYRMIVECATGAMGPGMTVQLGTTRDPTAKLAWGGGEVAGRIGYAPDSRSLIATLFDRTPRQLMLVADPPLGGLAPNKLPDVQAIPNNHLAYAVQWFLFAGIAAAIYVLALRRRQRREGEAPQS